MFLACRATDRPTRRCSADNRANGRGQTDERSSRSDDRRRRRASYDCTHHGARCASQCDTHCAGADRIHHRDLDRRYRRERAVVDGL